MLPHLNIETLRWRHSLVQGPQAQSPLLPLFWRGSISTLLFHLSQQFELEPCMSEQQSEPPLDKPDQHVQVEGMRMPNGSVYTGSLLNNKFDGRGILIYENKERYEGQFCDGMKHGKGKYYYIKGELYIGDWYQNKKHGKGLYFYENGKRYTGDFMNNMKHGEGRIDEEDGSYYIGKFFENNKDNLGEYFDANTEQKFLLQYEKGKQISCREIVEIPDVKKDNGLLNLPIDLQWMKDPKDIGDEYHSDNNFNNCQSLVINGKNFVSQCEPILENIRNLTKEKKAENKRGEMIVSNYFDKKLIDKKINEWEEADVNDWLNQIGFGDCNEEFRDNNILGDILLTLTNKDLKELKVAALGDRKILLREIEFLKLIFKRQCIGYSIAKLYHRELTLKLVRDLEKKKNLAGLQQEKILEEGAADTSSSSESDMDMDMKKAKMKKKSAQAKMNMKRKIEAYMEKKGIKLTFLIPKDQIEIIKPIGKGGYGQVFLGRWLGQDVAVKKYLKKQGFRNTHVGHFLEELEVINKLLHPSIVLYMGMCIYDNEYGMVTEFLSGGSLFDFLHKRGEKLNEERIFYILKDVALGMSYLHGKNVLHCDLKSSNVLIDENWNVKLCDFGLSRIKSNKKNKKNKLRVGTPHWMAPEILKGEKYECESDVYSFGILLWEMLTGQIPYKNLTTSEIIDLVSRETHHISVSNIQNQLFLNIFFVCTNRDPQKRPTFKMIVDMLEKEEAQYGSVD